MGSSFSRSSEAPAAAPAREGRFGVRMTPALIESTGAATGGVAAAGAAGSSDVQNEMLQRAYNEGAQAAAQHYAQQQSAERESIIKQTEEQNEKKKEALAVRIEELRNREYRAPSAPMGCKEEREAVMACYRAHAC